MPVTILVVEDEPAIQELIAVNLEQAGHRVQRALTAEVAMVAVRETVPDLVLLDWMLPGASGIEFARRLRGDGRTRSVPIIMLTSRASEQDKLVGFETGVDDYITKPFSSRELNARIKAVLRRRTPELADEVVEFCGLRLDATTHRVTCGEREIDLGLTEFRLLHFFMSRPERVYSRAQLIDQIWGKQVYIEERTVDVHIRRLRVALQPTAHDGLVQTVRGAGYRLSTN